MCVMPKPQTSSLFEYPRLDGFIIAWPMGLRDFARGELAGKTTQRCKGLKKCMREEQRARTTIFSLTLMSGYLQVCTVR